MMGAGDAKVKTTDAKSAKMKSTKRGMVEGRIGGHNGRIVRRRGSSGQGEA
jgi:hypothetical protein